MFDSHFRWFPRVLMAVAAAWIAVIGASAILVLATGASERNPQLGLKGMYIRDPLTGYRLKPRWRGVYDDGRVSARYEINSLGHRDDEPLPEPISRVILAGDSFTFGALLDQADTIDKQIESVSGGRVDAYNLGVMGYGPPAILETLKRASVIDGAYVLYLFFNNDLRDDNLLPDNGCTVHRGYLVRIRDFDGTRLGRAQIRSRIRHATQAHPLRGVAAIVTGAPLFSRIHEPIAAVYREARFAVIGEAALSSGPLRGFSSDNVHRAAEYVDEMAEFAFSRNAKFAVVIIPTKAEAREATYSLASSAFIAELTRRQIDTIDMLAMVSERDYFAHDDHFNASGARRAACTILAALDARSTRQASDRR